MSYTRVIPRDLFNEAKLLKCMGQLALLIHDGVKVPRGLELAHDDSECPGFAIEQEESTGALYVANVELTYDGRLIGLRSRYNSKDAYPLYFILGEDEGPVFNESGALSAEFHRTLSFFRPFRK